MSIERKNEHIRFALQTRKDYDVFRDVHILYDSIPEINFDEIDLSSRILGRYFHAPLIINAITGGMEEGRNINRALAIAAREFGIPMAVGSQSIALRDESLKGSFSIVREVNCDGFIMANLGANTSLEDVKRAVDMIQANALQLHLNVLQELIMPEGDRNFKGILENIKYIKENVGVPVVVKEVGFGMSGQTVRKLKTVGINTIDIGGYGGTNFARIELSRRSDEIGKDLSKIGIPTPVSLYDICKNKFDIEVICGGGIKGGLDVVKSIIMGADAASVAYVLLKAYEREKESGVIKEVDRIIQEIRICMMAVGAVNLKNLHEKKLFITGETLDWVSQL